MKRHAFKVLAMSTLFVLLLGMIAYAQIEPRVIANIPFDFIVGKKTLPAGEYTIDRPEISDPNVLLIRSSDSHFAVFANAESVRARQIPDKSELIFNRIGDNYFLSKVFVSGEDIGCEIQKPRAERKLEQSASNTSMQTVTVQSVMPVSQASE